MQRDCAKMIRFVILALFVASCSGYPQLRIVNGTNAREGEFPSVVSLRYNLRHICGGTILNERFILTAAHCACDDDRPDNPTNYSIQYGSIHITQTEERSVRVEKIICGPFNMARLDYDVAVLKLRHQIPHDGRWEPVRLSTHFDTSKQHKGVVVGWGRLWQNGPIPSVLQKLEVTTFTNFVCGLRFDNFHHICFGANIGGVCNGDSGTSLMVAGEQVGIASFITAPCGTTSALTPNVYARVPSYYDWIREHSRH